MSKTKSSLLMSALSLLLCVSMLIGTTFAWFTDSVTSSNNIIKSGTLKVQMEWRDASGAEGTQTTYKDASSGAIFNSELWEPGYTDAKNIKISNIGTLALKYHLNIAPTGEVSELAEVIDVFFAEGEIAVTDRTMTSLTKVGTLADILAGMPANMSGDLEAEDSVTVTIALKMQEEAGNEYQELSIGSDFAVVLLATQDNVEPDSIDKDYDDIEIPDMSIEKVDGVTYGTTIDNDYVMISVDDYTLTSHSVNENVTILGTGNGVNDNDRVFGKNAPLTTLTLPEGLVEIKDNALNALPNLTTVNLPSTLKTIGIQSFRTTGMSSLTIPESVETVKLGAFRDMANLTTVTVEGNVAFDNYAFRSCPNLTSIYLLGDDVTFSGSQFATHGDNGDANGITIYVKNATVAARVYAAQGSAYGYEVKILGDANDGSDAGDVAFVKASNATQLQDALSNANEGTTIVTLQGDITESLEADLKANTDVIIEGNGKTISAPIVVDGQSATITTAGLTIQNVNFTADNADNFNGADACIRLGDGTNDTRYTCNVTVTGCTFDIPGMVGVKSYTGGDKNLTITNCTATSKAHSLLQAKGIDGILVKNCKIYSKNGVNFNNSTNVTVEDCIIDVKGYAVRFGESSGGVGAAETYLIKDCTLKSECNDGDAVIVLRGTADYSTLTIENTTIEGTIEITNTATGTTIIK